MWTTARTTTTTTTSALSKVQEFILRRLIEADQLQAQEWARLRQSRVLHSVARISYTK